MLRCKGGCKARGLIKGEISVPGAEKFSFEQMKLNKNKKSIMSPEKSESRQ